MTLIIFSGEIIKKKKAYVTRHSPVCAGFYNLDLQVEDDVKPAVEKLCAKIKENVDVTNDPLAEGLTMGTAMFELYLALQEFAKFKENLSPT